ncbi:DUF1684 domain-containing protein [Pseudactinotalea sp. HY158]|uniref:DUF1684 domain-containing protein n=1 Tax=Pseudactinotalea sp. HY158 TaxID=2654547 RepID=UPI00129CA2A4|nr:DUF1684 domain-containing protein [Pseudactinotalea sp. HY158]QGH68209.1 DUF1684 domain-containing protein [Pseudactinotalea sp. HY158]
MTVVEHLEGQWRQWRHDHVAEMFRPYGWTALVAQHWLRPGDEGVELDDLPGTWSVADGRVIFTPPATGPTLAVDGSHPTDPVEIVPGRNQTYGHGRSVPVYFGVCEVETIERSDNAGNRLFAVRVRDPRSAASAGDAGVRAFDYDPTWRIPGVFTPFDRRDVEAETVEAGVRELTPHIGTFTFTHAGASHEVVVLGKETATGVQPVVHFRDATNGDLTYGAGRVVEIDFVDDGAPHPARIDWIDFNYAVALPCAFTNFVTCPLPPAQNRLDLAVRAGEQRPARDVARVLTFDEE